MNENEIQAAVKAYEQGLMQGAKHDVTGTTTTTGFAHGSGGLWSLAGQNQRVWSVMVGLRSLATQLPTVRTNISNPLQSYFTGVQAVSGSNPTSLCGDAQMAGLSKTAAITRTFGNYQFETDQVNINRFGQQLYGNNGDPMNLFLQNVPDQGGAIFPNFNGAADLRRSLNGEIAKRFFELQMAFARKLAAQTYTGNPANNTPLLGYPNNFYAEFNGLQILVNTGYRDTVTGVAVPSLDSDVKNFGNARIDQSGPAFVNNLVAMTRYLNWKADTQGFGNVEWAFVMRPQAFWATADVWPCAYNTTTCVSPSAATGSSVFVDGNRNRELTTEILRSRRLMIDGIEYPVILDSFMPETQPVAGVFSSDIYLVPLRVDGIPVLYWETFDEGNEQISQALNQMGLGPEVFTSDGGAYIVWVKRTNLCVQWQAKTQPRLVLETPQLAGRLTSVRYWTLQHESDPNTTSGYHQDGGGTSRTGPSLFTPVAA